jgi:hypothetical protein
MVIRGQKARGLGDLFADRMRVLAILGQTADKDVPRTAWDVDQNQRNKQEIMLVSSPHPIITLLACQQRGMPTA